MFLCERISVSVQCDKIWEGPGDEANISSHNREVAAVWMWLQFGELIHLVLPCSLLRVITRDGAI